MNTIADESSRGGANTTTQKLKKHSVRFKTNQNSMSVLKSFLENKNC